MIFTITGSFSNIFDAVHGQALKAIFKIGFPNMTLTHKLDLFDKLVELV